MTTVSTCSVPRTSGACPTTVVHTSLKLLCTHYFPPSLPHPHLHTVIYSHITQGISAQSKLAANWWCTSAATGFGLPSLHSGFVAIPKHNPNTKSSSTLNPSWIIGFINQILNRAILMICKPPLPSPWPHLEAYLHPTSPPSRSVKTTLTHVSLVFSFMYDGSKTPMSSDQLAQILGLPTLPIEGGNLWALIGCGSQWNATRWRALPSCNKWLN